MSRILIFIFGLTLVVTRGRSDPINYPAYPLNYRETYPSSYNGPSAVYDGSSEDYGYYDPQTPDYPYARLFPNEFNPYPPTYAASKDPSYKQPYYAPNGPSYKQPYNPPEPLSYYQQAYNPFYPYNPPYNPSYPPYPMTPYYGNSSNDTSNYTNTYNYTSMYSNGLVYNNYNYTLNGTYLNGTNDTTNGSYPLPYPYRAGYPVHRRRFYPPPYPKPYRSPPEGGYFRDNSYETDYAGERKLKKRRKLHRRKKPKTYSYETSAYDDDVYEQSREDSNEKKIIVKTQLIQGPPGPPGTPGSSGIRTILTTTTTGL